MNDDAPSVDEPVENTAARTARLGKALRGALAAILTLEAVVVLLVPRAIAQTGTGLGGFRLALLLVLALALVATGFLLRRPGAIAAGSFLQVPLALTGVWTSAMFLLALMFGGCWFYLLKLRHELLGTPGGVWMLLG